MQLSERSYPVLSRVCIGVGVVFLGLSAFGNWRFGWSLSSDPVDQWWLAIIYGGSDVAAGVLVATGATMLRHPGWQWKAGGVLALLPATILVALSILSTFGMMSGRIATLAGQTAALKVDEGRLTWLRGQVVNREIPRSERRLALKEEREASKEARRHAAVVTDNQAVAISNAAAQVGVKLSVEQTQIGLTFVSSTMPMTIKFVCIGLGFFLYGARTSQAATDNKAREAKPSDKPPESGSGGGSGGRESFKPTIVQNEPPKPEPLRAKPNGSATSKPVPMKIEPPKVSSAMARVIEPSVPPRDVSREEVKEILRRQRDGKAPRQSSYEIAAYTGVPQRTISRWQKRLNGQTQSRHRRYAGNGGGHHHAVN